MRAASETTAVGCGYVAPVEYRIELSVYRPLHDAVFEWQRHDQSALWVVNVKFTVAPDVICFPDHLILYRDEIFFEALPECHDFLPISFAFSCLQICVIQVLKVIDFRINIVYSFQVHHTHKQARTVRLTTNCELPFLFFALVAQLHGEWPLYSFVCCALSREAALSDGRSKAEQNPMLPFEFERLLLTFKANTPALEPLFQLPPASGSRIPVIPQRDTTSLCFVRLLLSIHRACAQFLRCTGTFSHNALLSYTAARIPYVKSASTQKVLYRRRVTSSFCSISLPPL